MARPDESELAAGPAVLRQLVLDFPVTGSFRTEDFLASDCNRAALAMLLGWQEWPQPACILIGPPGSGRSHLAHIFARDAGARLLQGPELWRVRNPLDALGEARALVVDDADATGEPRRLLELYNLIVERRGRMLLTALAPPRSWGLDLADLRSRLEAALVVEIAPPDEGLLAAVLVKQLADRQLQVEPEVVHYLVTHMERTFAAARRLVVLLDRLSLATRRAVTMPLARLALSQSEAEGGSPVP